MDSSVLEPRRWGEMFTLLSMDIVIPMYERMGLELTDRELFKQLLRGEILANRKEYEANPQRIPPIADKYIKKLVNSFDIKTTHYFYKWATTVFTAVPADQPDWSSWRIIFFYWQNKGKWQDVVRKRMPGKKIDLIIPSYIDYQDEKNTEMEIEEIKKKQLSDWDLEMFSIHKYFYNETDLDDNNDPFLTIQNTIEINRLQLFWEDILLPNLSIGEKNILREEGEKFLLAIGAYLPEESGLIHPDQLRRQR